MEREIIRKIIIEGQEFVNEIPLIKRPFFLRRMEIMYLSVSDKQESPIYYINVSSS